LVKEFKAGAYSVMKSIKALLTTKIVSVKILNKQSVEIANQSVVWFWQQVNHPKQFSNFFKNT